MCEENRSATNDDESLKDMILNQVNDDEDREPLNSTDENQDTLATEDYDSHRPQVLLDRPKIRFEDAFQRDAFYNLVSVENNLVTEFDSEQISEDGSPIPSHSIPIMSSSITGESGSGLTLMLAKKAYENYQDNRPTIIIAHREHLFNKIAQTIVDCADPERPVAAVPVGPLDGVAL